MKFAVVAHSSSQTNTAIAAAGGGPILRPREALLALGPGDVALARIDVLETLEGPEPGMLELERLAAGGVVVLNTPSALLACHDKLLTARALRLAGLPHPRTALLRPDAAAPPLEFPLVLKPRFGSWGRNVALCRNEPELWRAAGRTGPHRLVQELVPPLGHDLRVVVAAGRVVGAARRDAAPGEWRTNVALGGTTSPVEPPPAACWLAERAAAVIGADLVGVDLLPTGPGRWTILELNGAADFNPVYGRGVFGEAVSLLLGRAQSFAARVA